MDIFDEGKTALEVFLVHCHECHVCDSSAAVCPEGEALMIRWRRSMEGPRSRKQPSDYWHPEINLLMRRQAHGSTADGYGAATADVS